MTLPWWAFKVAGMADSSGGLISPVAIQRPLQAPLHVCTYPASATQPDSSGVAYVSGCAKQHLYDCKLTVRLHTHTAFQIIPLWNAFRIQSIYTTLAL